MVCQIGHCARSPGWFLSQIDQITCQTRSCQIAPPARSFKSYLMPDCEVRQIAGVAPDMRTGASGIASKIFQRRLGYQRSCSRYQYVIWGLQHRLSSPRILLQGGSGIAGVVTGTNVGLRLSSPRQSTHSAWRAGVVEQPLCGVIACLFSCLLI